MREHELILPELTLEGGGRLTDVQVHYRVKGDVAREPVVWVFHALTANDDPTDWWAGLFGPDGFYGKGYAVVCVNVLGSPYGSTSPLRGAQVGLEFPLVTVRDTVRCQLAVARELGIRAIHTAIGGSFGGYQALEFALAFPGHIAHLVLVATGAEEKPWSKAIHQAQRLALKADPSFMAGGGQAGLRAARAMGMVGYRTPEQYNSSQADAPGKLRDFRAASYINYQGQKLVDRFDAQCYYALTEQLDTHDVGRGRGGIPQALSALQVPTLVLGISSDLLLPVAVQAELARCLPRATFEVIESPYGHDGFLVEHEKITQHLTSFTMKKIIHLSSTLFEPAADAALARALAELAQDVGGLVVPSAQVQHVKALAGVEVRGYAPGAGKQLAAQWATQTGASSVEQWASVGGVHTADPEKLATAEIIDRLSYQEAMELAASGTQLLDRRALAVLADAQIPLFIRSLDGSSFTWVDAEGSDKPVKAVGVEGPVALLKLGGPSFHGVPGIDARAFGALSEAGVSVKLVSQASSERSLGVVVASRDAEKGRAALEAAFTSQEATVSVRDGLTVLNITGRHNYALERAIFELRRNAIWLHLIANSVEGHQISLVLDGEKERKALKLVHDQLLGRLKPIHVFCIGKGLVGGTLIRQVLESREHVASKRKIDLRIIGVADSRGAFVQGEGIGADWREKLAGAPLDASPKTWIAALEQTGLSNIVVVDNTADQGITDAYPDFVRAGFDLVASNKKGNAREQHFYDQLRALLERKGKQFKYETNVGAGLPLIDTLLQLHHSSDRITRIKGVFSGSMSYLFNTFSESDRAFSEVLEEAKAKGYTEPDPREDLGGMDVARKLLILARTVDIRAELTDVAIENLIPPALRTGGSYSEFQQQYDALDTHYAGVKAALKQGEVLRFVGDLQVDEWGKAKLTVELIRTPKSSPLGGIKGSDSLFEIYTDGYGDHPMVIQGAGAGAEVTARGVYSDILRLG